MILDNRQAVPDIIVSKDGVPNNMLYNVNNNVRAHQPHIPKRSPKAVRELPKPKYVTGNNNGSPLHVPKNGNVYTSTDSRSMIPRRLHRKIPSAPNSPIRFSRRNSDIPKSPVQIESPKKLNVDRKTQVRRTDSIPTHVYDYSSGEFSDSLSESRIPVYASHRVPIVGALGIPNGRSKLNHMNLTYTKEDFGRLDIARRSDRNSFGDSSVSSRDSLEDPSWNWNQGKWNTVDSGNSWDIDQSEEDNGKIGSCRPVRQSLNGSYSEEISDYTSDTEEIKLLTDDDASFSERDPNLSSKMVVIKCKDSNYLTRILVNKKGIHGVKVVGRLGSKKGRGMSADQAFVYPPTDIHCRDSERSLSQATDNEFEHETADYQWLLDYEYSFERYRESYSKDSLTSTRETPARVSVLQTTDSKPEFSYETISRNLDANLAEIDMDDFRSEDINQLLTLPNICSQYQDGDELSTSLDDTNEVSDKFYEEKGPLETFQKSCDLADDEEYSGVSGDASFYQSGPLFSPLKEPPQIPPSFSVDSLDNEIHDDLILTCQANKDNYTIAFEGSYIHMSENSDYHDTGGSKSAGSNHWSTEQLEGQTDSNMCHSDQPYTTWSRVSRRSSNSQSSDQCSTPVRHVNSPAAKPHRQYLKEPRPQDDTKSSSMPNLMRKSLMRRSLEGHCVKVYDLQNSLRCSQLSNCRSGDGNNFSLVRLFMKQKSLSKDGVSLSSSCTDPSQEGACSTSDNQSGVESSDWPMNSQSENDMDGSTSPIPSYNQLRFIERTRKGHSPNIMSLNEEDTSTETTEGFINNNNNTNTIDNITNQINTVDNVNFDDSLKEINSCSKPPMTSPIREEPEGMDISMENRPKVDTPNILLLKKPKINNKDTSAGIRVLGNKNSFNSYTPDKVAEGTRSRQDSGNSSSGYQSGKSTDKIRRLEPERIQYLKDKPRPKPRSLKQFTDQSLQTSNLKVSAGVNTSSILEKKDVYVYYPNYALPDLSFLKEKKYHMDARIFLVPQKYNPCLETTKPKKRRPFSMNDISKMKQNITHVQDWESLNCLLPKDIKDILEDGTECMETHKPSFCGKRRPLSHGFITQKDIKHTSTSTQPSSGYRGSSTMLNDFEDSEPEVLPKGVLRKCTSLRKRETNLTEDAIKRRSLPEMDEEKPNAGFSRKRSQTLDQISARTAKAECHNPIRSTTESGLGSMRKPSSSTSEELKPIIYDSHDKKTLVISVRTAVEKLVSHFKLATSKERIKTSTTSAEAAQIALDKLCPAMYALLSDGMLPSLNSLFGKITNNVWKVIEATSQLGPSTKALNDLVMTLNSEECLSEGPLKFNAFIFGLLNLRSIDAWLSYLRTRETALQKHYHPDSFLYLSNTAMRGLYDDLIRSLKPLALLPLQLDLLFEYKTLHASLLKMEELAQSIPAEASLFDHLLAAKECKELRNAATQQDRVRALMKALSGAEPQLRSRSNSPRPRSCCEEDVAHDSSAHMKKRWSNVQLGSKLLTAIDKLMIDQCSSEDYTDSIDNPNRKEALGRSSSSVDISERSATDKDTENEKDPTAHHTKGTLESEGERFRRLQLKWEQMAICNPKKESERNDKSISPGCVSRSRIPRPVSMTSPQSFKPFEPAKEKTKKAAVPRPTPRKSLKDTETLQPSRPTGARSKVTNRTPASNSRASSVPGRGIDRGSSTRYDSKRRSNVRSASHGRTYVRTNETRLVQTLHHRLATDNGHLSFSRGDILTLVIEVDDKYLLCCHNDRKGLVPKSAVIPVHH